MQDIRALSNFLAAAGKKFQTHPSDIAQEIYQALVSDLIPRQSLVVEAAPVDVSLSSFLQDGQSDLISLLLQCSDLLSWRCPAPYIRPVIFVFSHKVSGTGGRMFNA